MNNLLFMSMGLPFSMFTWMLKMAFVALLIAKFEFPFKN